MNSFETYHLGLGLIILGSALLGVAVTLYLTRGERRRWEHVRDALEKELGELGVASHSVLTALRLKYGDDLEKVATGEDRFVAQPPADDFETKVAEVVGEEVQYFTVLVNKESGKVHTRGCSYVSGVREGGVVVKPDAQFSEVWGSESDVRSMVKRWRYTYCLKCKPLGGGT